MIRLSLGMLVLVCMGTLLLSIFAAWTLFESRRQRRERRAFENVYRCSSCGCEFEETSEEVLARCPRCGTLNERYRLSRL
jgi:rubrerythrin